MGAGPIGLATLLCLRAAGASFVAVAEVADERKRKATELGASVVIDPNEQDLAVETARLTGGGFDAVFECAGVPATFQGRWIRCVPRASSSTSPSGRSPPRSN